MHISKRSPREERYLPEEEFSNLDSAQLIRLMVEDDVFWWLTTIGALLSDLVSHEHFTALTCELVGRVGGDLASGPLLDGIMNAGLKNPSIAKNRVDEMLGLHDSRASAAAASLLGSVACTDDSWFRNKLSKLMDSNDDTDLSVAYRSANLCIRHGCSGASWSAEQVLVARMPETLHAQIAYSLALDAIARTEPNAVADRYVLILKNGFEQVKVYVLEDATRNDCLSTSMLKSIVESAKDASEKAVRREIAAALERISRDDPRYFIDFIHGILAGSLLSEYFGIGETESLLMNIGRENSEYIFGEVDSWLDEGNYRLEYEASDILKAVFSASPIILITEMQKWNPPDVLRFNIRLEILRDLISERLDTDDKSMREIIDSCVLDVEALARDLNLDLKSLAAGMQSRVYRALIVIESIVRPVREVDYEQLEFNLKMIPSVVKFIGREWFDGMKASRARGHLILHMFDTEIPSDKVIIETEEEFGAADSIGKKMMLELRMCNLRYRKRTCSYWNDIFSRLDSSQPGMSECRADIQRSEGVDDVLCELELISLYSRNHRVLVRRKAECLKGTYDLCVSLTSQSPIIEVYNPQPERKLRLATGAHGLDTERLKMKLLEKFEKKFSFDETEVNYPYVFAVHAYSGGFHVTDVHMNDLFEGERSLVILNPNASAVSGVLVYRRDLANPDGFVIQAQYYPNPSARILLNDQSVQELKMSLEWPNRVTPS